MREFMLYEGLRMETLHGMRLTSKAPTCYITIKREYGLRGSREKVLAAFRKMLWDSGILNAKNDRQGELK